MKSLNLNLSPKEIMHHYGKSFYFASMVFSKNTAQDVFQLYQYCRYVDDCGDELHPEQGKKRLNELISVINNEATTSPENLKSLVQNILNKGVVKEDLKILIYGALYEAKGNKINSKQDLIHYCYLVAGVVGKMMCPLIGVKNNLAAPYAIDLGVGMQLTNICRDVLEDKNNKRSYLWTLQTEAKDFATQYNRQVVLEHLDLADAYYKSAFTGLSYIPFRSRLAIFIASEIYRAIGTKIRRSGERVFKERIYLSSLEKFWVCLKSSVKLLHPNFWTPQKHKKDLHTELNLSLEGFKA